MRIICLERDPIDLMRLKYDIRSAIPKGKGASIRGFLKKEKALRAACSEGCDVFFTELENDEYISRGLCEKLELARRIQRVNPNVNLIFAVHNFKWVSAETFMELRISGYVTKPYIKEEIAEELANLRYGKAVMQKTGGAQAEKQEDSHIAGTDRMKVIWVEPDRIWYKEIPKIMQQAAPDAEVHSFAYPKEALKYADTESFDVVVIGIDFDVMYEEYAIETARKFQQINPGVNIIFHAICMNFYHMGEILKLRLSGCILKSFKPGSLAEEFARLRYRTE